MRTIYLMSALLCLLLSNPSHAQSLPHTAKGKVLLGLDGALTIGGGQQKNKIDGDSQTVFKNFGFTVSPRTGIFVLNNLAIGLDLEYGYNSATTEVRQAFDEVPSEAKFRTNTYSINTFWRYYFKAGPVSPFIDSFAGFGRIKLSNDLSDIESTSNLFQFGGSLGLAVPLGSKVTFDSMLTFSNFTETEREDNPRDAKTINQSLFFSTGFSVYLD